MSINQSEPMDRVIFFIDGFNLYHALEDNTQYHKYKWLDLSLLCTRYLTSKDSLKDIYYFTALATWNPNKVKRHQIYIRALEWKGVKVIYGQFKLRDRTCNLCNRQYTSYDEKKTDINITVKLFQLAYQDQYDKGIIISGDSDLISAVEGVRSTFPAKKIGLVIPIGRRSESLKQIADFHMKMKEKHLKSSQYDAVIDLGNNQKLICPPTWQ